MAGFFGIRYSRHFRLIGHRQARVIAAWIAGSSPAITNAIVTLALTRVSVSDTFPLRTNLAHVKDASQVTAAGVASAVPAGGGSSLPFPGGFGYQPADTMTGTRGARCNRGR